MRKKTPESKGFAPPFGRLPNSQRRHSGIHGRFAQETDAKEKGWKRPKEPRQGAVPTHSRCSIGSKGQDATQGIYGHLSPKARFCTNPSDPNQSFGIGRLPFWRLTRRRRPLQFLARPAG
jgi:hypothetical protein